MSYSPVTNLYEIAQDQWTPSQFRDKLIYQAILESLTKEVQSLEDLLYQMYVQRSLPSAYGEQLDNLGANMGVTRLLGQDDESYRTAIYAEIFMRRSDGSANYIMGALKSIYKSPTAKIFEHNTPMTGSVVVVVNQPTKMPSSVNVLKKMAAVAIQSVVILRDPTPQGYAWTPVEVVGSTSALVTSNDEWFITDSGLGVVVQTGNGQAVKDQIGSLGDPGFLTTPLGLDVRAAVSPDPENDLGITAKGGNRLLNIQKEIPVGGVFGIMAEVSQLRKGHTDIEGEK